MTIPQILDAQRAFFRSGATMPVAFRKEQLRRLRSAISRWEEPLYEALWDDLHKSREEAFLTEISIVTGEIRRHLRHVGRWTARKRLPSPLAHFPSRSYIVSEPLGNALIIAPWNYPFQLLINPLVAAISSGCTAVLKPSPSVPRVSAVLQSMIDDCFSPEYVAVVQGHRDVNAELLAGNFDILFLTGSPALGRVAMEAAARTLTPVVLELGGKSPCIVDRDADLRTAARRIAWGKTLNAGQTCIAPDYLFLHGDIREAFIEEFKAALVMLHGADIRESRHYGRMVSDSAFDRVASYLEDGKILAGGQLDRASRFIEPTLLEVSGPDSPVMTHEIFGPVFPVMSFTDSSEVVEFIRSREKPLAMYYFGKESRGWDMLGRCSSGGACINDTIMHIANDRLPFGGVGASGIGAYHGKDGFLAFSHRKSVVSTPTWIDLPFRYMPYRFFSLVRKLLG